MLISSYHLFQIIGVSRLLVRMVGHLRAKWMGGVPKSGHDSVGTVINQPCGRDYDLITTLSLKTHCQLFESESHVLELVGVLLVGALVCFDLSKSQFTLSHMI